MKMEELIRRQQLNISAYPHPFNERAAQWANEPDLQPMLKCKLLEQSMPLIIGDNSHQVHVTILVGHTAVILRGMDDQLLETPTLCFDGEALCYELHRWRENAGFHSYPPHPIAVEDAIEEVLDDPFSAALSDLAYKLEALSLIESLPKESKITSQS